MHDLIGTYERLERMYRLYIRSAFPLRSEALEKERDKLLREGEILSQPPLIETVPVYPSSGDTLQEATQNLLPEYAGLADLGKELLPAPLQLYSHQWDSLREVLMNQKDLVVTTNPQLESDLFTVARRYLFQRYLSPYESIFEFGCGSCQNLLLLANLFPDKKLTGLDWVEPAVNIANLIGKQLNQAVTGRIFNMLDPSSAFSSKLI